MIESKIESAARFLKAIGYPKIMACYFVFEGIDDSGKTTLIHQLAERFRKQGFRVEIVSEPYDFPQTVHDFFSQIDGWTEHPWWNVYYYQVGRFLLRTRLAALFRSVEDPDGSSEPFVLLQDRSFISTMVYQADALNLADNPQRLESFWRVIADGALHEAALPDRVILMEPPLEIPLTDPQRRLKALYREAFAFLEREYSLKTQAFQPGLWQDPDAYEAALAMLTNLALKWAQGLDNASSHRV